jgi:hypothetical protein
METAPAGVRLGRPVSSPSALGGWPGLKSRSSWFRRQDVALREVKFRGPAGPPGREIVASRRLRPAARRNRPTAPAAAAKKLTSSTNPSHARRRRTRARGHGWRRNLDREDEASDMGASLRQLGARALIWLNRRRRQGRKLTRPSGGRAEPPAASGRVATDQGGRYAQTQSADMTTRKLRRLVRPDLPRPHRGQRAPRLSWRRPCRQPPRRRVQRPADVRQPEGGSRPRARGLAVSGGPSRKPLTWP